MFYDLHTNYQEFITCHTHRAFPHSTALFQHLQLHIYLPRLLRINGEWHRGQCPFSTPPASHLLAQTAEDQRGVAQRAVHPLPIVELVLQHQMAASLAHVRGRLLDGSVIEGENRKGAMVMNTRKIQRQKRLLPRSQSGPTHQIYSTKLTCRR